MEPLKNVSAFQRCAGVFVLLIGTALSLSVTEAQTVNLGEAVDNTALTWTSGGSMPWFGQTSVYYYDGDAAQSGAPSSGQSSWIETTVSGPGLLTFYWKVSAGAASELDFYVDDARQAECSSINWQMRAHSIPSGLHTLRWDYTPVIQSSGDAGWLDKVTYSPQPAIVVNVPNGGETLRQREFYTIRWANSADIPNVKIELYKGGSPLYTIAANTPSNGSYDWLIPLGLDPAADYRVRVAVSSNPSVYDESDADFSIATASQPSLKGALILDGIDDYAEAADHSELDLAGGSFTVESWVNFQNLGGVFIKAGAYGMHVESTYSYPSWIHCMWIDYPCVKGCCTSSRYLSLGWHHVALVYDVAAGQARAYYDGTQRCSATCTASNSDQALWVGRGLGGFLEGAVDEMRISNVVRYNGNFTPPTEPFACDDHTLALWHFDEFAGATVSHDVCGAADNILIGSNGAHTEGVLAHQIFLPIVIR